MRRLRLPSCPVLKFPRVELLADYLGRDGRGMITALSSDKHEDLNAIDRELSDLSVALSTLGTGFHPAHERFVWVPSDEEPLELTPEDVEDGMVERHLHFIQERRLCIMQFVDGPRRRVTPLAT